MPTFFYRYISNQKEADQIIEERRVQSLNTATQYETWYTPVRYDDAEQARQELAMYQVPGHRIGPILEVFLPPLRIQLRIVGPAYNNPGGGLEISTLEPVWLLGLWGFNPKKWHL
jgi:hypothetical protein